MRRTVTTGRASATSTTPTLPWTRVAGSRVPDYPSPERVVPPQVRPRLRGFSLGAPKGRCQTGFVITDGDYNKAAFMYVRATQCHGLSFVREARLAVPLTTYEEFRATTIAVWHAAMSEKSAAIILEQGLVPEEGGESYGGRNSVHLMPTHPYDGNFEAHYLRGPNAYLCLDPVSSTPWPPALCCNRPTEPS